MSHLLCTNPLALRIPDPYSVGNTVIARLLTGSGAQEDILFESLTTALLVDFGRYGVDFVTAEHFRGGDHAFVTHDILEFPIPMSDPVVESRWRESRAVASECRDKVFKVGFRP